MTSPRRRRPSAPRAGLLSISLARGGARVLSWKGGTAGRESLDSMSLDELQNYSTAAIAGIDTKSHQPIRIESFRC